VGFSAQWAKRAAANGEVAAMVHLGRYYTDGVGAKPNPEKGIEWYTVHPIRPLV
jgi:TPR repeat protein